MKYKINPKNGDKISTLGFGCMRLSGSLTGAFTGVGLNTQKAEQLIKAAIDKGINYFDTAYLYVKSEEVLGNTLAKYGLRKDVYIATKLPLMMCKSKADLDKIFNKQLERLQTDYIDYYLFHMLSDMETWEKLRSWGVEEWIREKKEAGQIRQIGFSFHGIQEEFLSLLDAYDWDHVLIQYNYSDENFQAGVTGLKKAASKGITVFIMEPLLGGMLASSLPKKAVECFKNANPNISHVAWAFKWLWNQEEVTCVLSGMNEMCQLEENVLTAENTEVNSLSQKEIETYGEVKKIFKESFKVPCTGCRYCIPCPFGVDIPTCFTAYNTYSTISKSQAKIQYMMGTMMSNQPGYARLCRKCGKCEPLCPQKIQIVKNLEKVQKHLEGFAFPLMAWGTKVFMGKKKNNEIIHYFSSLLSQLRIHQKQLNPFFFTYKICI